MRQQLKVYINDEDKSKELVIEFGSEAKITIEQEHKILEELKQSRDKIKNILQ